VRHQGRPATGRDRVPTIHGFDRIPGMNEA
jgi:hypothetical protein